MAQCECLKASIGKKLGNEDRKSIINKQLHNLAVSRHEKKVFIFLS